MPNTFDEFGQPLVMMPYPQQQPTSLDVPATISDSALIDNSDGTALEFENQTEELQATDDSSAVTDPAPGIENMDPIPEASLDADKDPSEEHQDEMVEISFSILWRPVLKYYAFPD